MDLPLPFQIVATAILTPAESFLAAHVSKIVCAYTDYLSQQDSPAYWSQPSPMTSDVLWALGFLVILFAIVVGLKQKAGMCLGMVVISSLLVALSVCMNVWQLRIP
jgi:hypothetical protein